MRTGPWINELEIICNLFDNVQGLGWESYISWHSKINFTFWATYGFSAIYELFWQK